MNACMPSILWATVTWVCIVPATTAYSAQLPGQVAKSTRVSHVPAASSCAGTSAPICHNLPIVTPQDVFAQDSSSGAVKSEQGAALCCVPTVVQAHPAGNPVAVPSRLAAGHLYWAGQNPYLVGRVKVDGSNLDSSLISPAGGNTVGVAVDHNYVYWTINGALSMTSSIGRAHLDGTTPDFNFIVLGQGHGPQDVAVDAQHIYWADLQLKAIGRANLDGSDVRPVLFSTGVNSGPIGVAIDANQVYWSDNYLHSIGRAGLDGANPVPFITGNGTNIIGVEVDGQHVYWVNYSTFLHTASIGRADLDGSNVNQSIVPSIGIATGITLGGGHVYWSNYGGSAIGRANLDGTNANPTFILVNGTVPYFLAFARD